ncbi:MAG TPA: BON domain-containing protein [Tepidisphaeraceae bacterium]|nr:BON domain-containing protein [Tepidisphaeraceae bacterium]
MNSGSTSNTSRSRGERQIEVLSSNESCRTGMMSGLTLAGGLALGAGLMYLLDPDEGADRRRTVKNLAGGAISASGSALQSGWDKLRDTAGRVYDAASEGASAFKDKLSEGAEYVTDNRYAKRISKSARRASGEASDRFGYLMHGRRSYGLQSGMSQGAAALACLALGVGAMYLLDPVDGERRRHVFRDKFLSAFGRMATKLEKQGRNIWNHATGMAYEARSSLSREQIDDRTLSERIRSTMGRYVDNVGAIDVQCIQGRVTLRGPVMASQLNRLLKGIRGVRGVSGIDNQLEVQAQRGSVGRENSFTRGGTSPSSRSDIGSTTSSTQI